MQTIIKYFFLVTLSLLTLQCKLLERVSKEKTLICFDPLSGDTVLVGSIQKKLLHGPVKARWDYFHGMKYFPYLPYLDQGFVYGTYKNGRKDGEWHLSNKKITILKWNFKKDTLNGELIYFYENEDGSIDNTQKIELK